MFGGMGIHSRDALFNVLRLCRFFYRNLEDLLPRFGYDKDITAKDEFIHLVSGYGTYTWPPVSLPIGKQ